MVMRLDKFLSNHGIGSRKEVKQYVKQQCVIVNDEIVKKADIKINEHSDVVMFDGIIIDYKPYVYIMLNKPTDYISATEDKYHQTVIDLMPEYSHYDIHPVGRLDIDTEGLLIMTNDGQLTHDVLSPKNHVNKVYYAKIDGEVTEETVEAFKRGVIIDGDYETMPAQLKILKQSDISEIELTIQEGKFHQVKRMFKSQNMTVTYLKRIQMGGLPLDATLELGSYRELTKDEIKLLKKAN